MSIKKRTLVFAVFVGVFLLSYTIGALNKMSIDEAMDFQEKFRTQTHWIGTLGIFSHNLSVAIIMFVPGFGIAWGSFTGWQTGAGFSALATSNPDLAEIPPLAAFFSSSYGVMELAAYSIGMSQSFVLIWRLVKRSQIKKEIIPTAIEVGIFCALLLIGAVIESSSISQMQQ